MFVVINVLGTNFHNGNLIIIIIIYIDVIPTL